MQIAARLPNVSYDDVLLQITLATASRLQSAPGLRQVQWKVLFRKYWPLLGQLQGESSA
jgi:hypothetical protein